MVRNQYVTLGVLRFGPAVIVNARGVDVGVTQRGWANEMKPNNRGRCEGDDVIEKWMVKFCFIVDHEVCVIVNIGLMCWASRTQPSLPRSLDQWKGTQL